MKRAASYRPQRSTAPAYVPPEVKARKASQQEARLGSRRGLYGRKWSAYRTSFLRRPENALCYDCLQRGQVTAAQEVDHIIAHQGDQALFWDVTNHQPLCKTCHSRKTATLDGGFGNRRRPAPGLVDQQPPPPGRSTRG